MYAYVLELNDYTYFLRDLTCFFGSGVEQPNKRHIEVYIKPIITSFVYGPTDEI